MANFPIDKLKFTNVEIKVQDSDVSIDIYIEPFELTLDDYSEIVDTSIRLGSVAIPSNPHELSGKKYQFPTNPESGYIDGSIYFFAAHNPVDITRIEFGAIVENRMQVEFEVSWILEYEMSGFNNFNSTVVAYIKL